MIAWIDKHKKDLWEWIVNCSDNNEDCKNCKYEKACDAIWDIAKNHVD